MRNPVTLGRLRESPENGRTAGLSLIEVACSMVVFALVLLSVGMTLMSGIDHRRESFNTYLAMNALRNKVAELQATANSPENLALLEGISSIYSRYNSSTSLVTSLSSGQISTTCYAKENALPTKLGSTLDLNIDGDCADLLDNASNGTDLKLVPIELNLTYTEDGVTRTKTIDRLITKTTN